MTVFIRTALSFSDNTRLLERTRWQSLTDALTGLGNRRKLMLDLDREFESKTPRRALLVILDLNGFKGYNDRFGHPSGDALLARLAAKLDAAFSGHAITYRLGGDEFCVYAPIEATDAEALIDRALDALSESGEGFAVTASCGATVLPDEATDAGDAMRIADQRLYAHKANQYRNNDTSYEVLRRALDEREPQLRQHLLDVAEFATRLGQRLGLSEAALTELRLAAELHDVGKLAIPDTILGKPAELSPAEWEFIRRHTTIGQRILAGAPALREIGDIVRSTHECWDGSGYPDGLRGEDIPLAARIVAICDAYTAMVAGRPYRAALPQQPALTELRRCAGTQFDPVLVTEFCDMLAGTTTTTDAPTSACAEARSA